MPGGGASTWEHVKPMLESISAKVDDRSPCVAWMGKGGAGHYVKIVNKGIENVDLQLIAEVYDLLHRGAGISNNELADIFATRNEGNMQSYLIEITSKILRCLDEETGMPLVDLILDEATSKGTGRWIIQISLDIGALVLTQGTIEHGTNIEMAYFDAYRSERLPANLIQA